MLKPAARLDAIERAHTTLGLPYSEVARILLTGESTLYRWRSGASAPTGVNRARLVALDEFVSALEEGFPDADAARSWLATPFVALGGQTPQSLLAEGRVELLVGALAVLAALSGPEREVGPLVDNREVGFGTPAEVTFATALAGAQIQRAWPDGPLSTED